MFKATGLFLLVLVVLLGLSLWVVSSGVLASIEEGTRSAGAAFTAQYAPAPFEIVGTAILDPSHGLPPIPFVVYTDAKGNTATKQLVFDDGSLCVTQRIAVSCTPLRNYELYFEGRGVRVLGITDDNLLYVQVIDIL